MTYNYVLACCNRVEIADDDCLSRCLSVMAQLSGLNRAGRGGVNGDDTCGY
jgi:hypothetical protein